MAVAGAPTAHLAFPTAPGAVGQIGAVAAQAMSGMGSQFVPCFGCFSVRGRGVRRGLYNFLCSRFVRGLGPRFVRFHRQARVVSSALLAFVLRVLALVISFGIVCVFSGSLIGVEDELSPGVTLLALPATRPAAQKHVEGVLAEVRGQVLYRPLNTLGQLKNPQILPPERFEHG